MVNDDIIHGYEREVVAWICKNYNQLGYDKILVENSGNGPDFTMLRKRKKVRVEVEKPYFITESPEKLASIPCKKFI